MWLFIAWWIRMIVGYTVYSSVNFINKRVALLTSMLQSDTIWRHLPTSVCISWRHRLESRQYTLVPCVFCEEYQDTLQTESRIWQVRAMQANEHKPLKRLIPPTTVCLGCQLVVPNRHSRHGFTSRAHLKSDLASFLHILTSNVNAPSAKHPTQSIFHSSNDLLHTNRPMSDNGCAVASNAVQ